MKGHLKLINGRKVESPIDNSCRPTSAVVREAVFNIVRHKINNSNWLDLYSGTGIMGCEAIAEGANAVVAIEINKKTYRTCKKNLITIADTNTKNVYIDVRNVDVNKFLKSGFQNYLSNIQKNYSQVELQFDFIYIDPPYNLKTYKSVLDNLIDGNWISSKCLAICEFSTINGIDIPSRWMTKDKKTYGNTGVLFLSPILA